MLRLAKTAGYLLSAKNSSRLLRWRGNIYRLCKLQSKRTKKHGLNKFQIRFFFDPLSEVIPDKICFSDFPYVMRPFRSDFSIVFFSVQIFSFARDVRYEIAFRLRVRVAVKSEFFTQFQF